MRPCACTLSKIWSLVRASDWIAANCSSCFPSILSTPSDVCESTLHPSTDNAKCIHVVKLRSSWIVFWCSFSLNGQRNRLLLPFSSRPSFLHSDCSFVSQLAEQTNSTEVC